MLEIRSCHSRPTLTRRLSILVALAVSVFLGSADQVRASEQWYVLRMGGNQAGWLRQIEQVKAEGELRVSSEMNLRIARGPIVVQLAISGESVESAEGQLRSMRSEQRLGAGPIIAEYRFMDDKVEVVEEQMGRRTTRSEPLPEGDWLAPGAVAAALRKRIGAGDKQITLATIDPSHGLRVITTTYTYRGKGVVEALGKVIPATSWTSTSDAAPGVESVEHRDEQGRMVRATMNMGFIEIEVLAAERAVATAEVTAPEILMRSLVEPDRPIRNPRTLRRGVYVLSLPESQSLPELPETSVQRVERDGPTVRLSVDKEKPRPEPTPPKDLQPYLAASPMIDAKDPLIVDLARKALSKAEKESPASRAEKLRRFVFGFVESKSLDVGLATASQVARTKQGDCTEHAVLLAALLRAQGIPSRVAVGLVYVDQFMGKRGVFGFHMWTQAFLDQGQGARWIDLDAALDEQLPSDATHLLLETMTFAPGEDTHPMVSLLPLFGGLKIVVESPE